MTPRQNIADWHQAPDPVLGAMIEAKRHGELTPHDCLRVGLLPLGWDRIPHDQPAGPSMSEVIPERISRAKAFIEQWNRDVRVRCLASELTDEQLQNELEVLNKWVNSYSLQPANGSIRLTRSAVT